MGQLTVTINERDYAIACDDGDEQRLDALARELDRRVGALAQSVGQVGHSRLLVIASLLMADELVDAQSEVARLTARSEASDSNANGARAAADGTAEDDRAAAATAQTLEDAAQRIDAIAARLQSS